MKYETRLRRVAQRLAIEREEIVEKLKREKLRRLNEVDRLQIQIDSFDGAEERFRSYQEVHRGAYQCPICWVTKQRHSDIRAANFRGEAFYICFTCGWEDRHVA